MPDFSPLATQIIQAATRMILPHLYLLQLWMSKFISDETGTVLGGALKTRLEKVEVIVTKGK